MKHWYDAETGRIVIDGLPVFKLEIHPVHVGSLLLSLLGKVRKHGHRKSGTKP